MAADWTGWTTYVFRNTALSSPPADIVQIRTGTGGTPTNAGFSEAPFSFNDTLGGSDPRLQGFCHTSGQPFLVPLANGQYRMRIAMGSNSSQPVGFSVKDGNTSTVLAYGMSKTGVIPEGHVLMADGRVASYKEAADEPTEINIIVTQGYVTLTFYGNFKNHIGGLETGDGYFRYVAFKAGEPANFLENQGALTLSVDLTGITPGTSLDSVAGFTRVLGATGLWTVNADHGLSYAGTGISGSTGYSFYKINRGIENPEKIVIWNPGTTLNAGLVMRGQVSGNGKLTGYLLGNNGTNLIGIRRLIDGSPVNTPTNFTIDPTKPVLITVATYTESVGFLLFQTGSDNKVYQIGSWSDTLSSRITTPGDYGIYGTSSAVPTFDVNLTKIYTGYKANPTRTPVAYQKKFLFTVWNQPSSTHATWKARGIDTLYGWSASLGETVTTWDASAASNGLTTIRQYYNSGDENISNNVMWALVDHPDSYEDGDTPPSGYTIVTDDGGLDISTAVNQVYALNTNKPITIALTSSNLTKLRDAMELKYLNEAKIDDFSSSDYPIGSNTPLLMSSFSPGSGYPPVSASTNYTTTAQGRALFALNHWKDAYVASMGKSYGQFIQTADFANNGKVPTRGEFRLQCMSAIINGAGRLDFMPQQGVTSGTLPFAHDGTPTPLVDEMALVMRYIRKLESLGVLVAFHTGRRKPFVLRQCAETNGDPNLNNASGKAPVGNQLPWPFEGARLSGSGNIVYLIQNLRNEVRYLTDATWGINNMMFLPYETKALDGRNLENFFTDSIEYNVPVKVTDSNLASYTLNKKMLVNTKKYTNRLQKLSAAAQAMRDSVLTQFQNIWPGHTGQPFEQDVTATSLSEMIRWYNSFTPGPNKWFRIRMRNGVWAPPDEAAAANRRFNLTPKDFMPFDGGGLVIENDTGHHPALQWSLTTNSLRGIHLRNMTISYRFTGASGFAGFTIQLDNPLNGINTVIRIENCRIGVLHLPDRSEDVDYRSFNYTIRAYHAEQLILKDNFFYGVANCIDANNVRMFLMDGNDIQMNTEDVLGVTPYGRGINGTGAAKGIFSDDDCYHWIKNNISRNQIDNFDRPGLTRSNVPHRDFIQRRTSPTGDRIPCKTRFIIEDNLVIDNSVTGFTDSQGIIAAGTEFHIDSDSTPYEGVFCFNISCTISLYGIFAGQTPGSNAFAEYNTMAGPPVFGIHQGDLPKIWNNTGATMYSAKNVANSFSASTNVANKTISYRSNAAVGFRYSDVFNGPFTSDPTTGQATFPINTDGTAPPHAIRSAARSIFTPKNSGDYGFQF